jgi:hypothetical protein
MNLASHKNRTPLKTIKLMINVSGDQYSFSAIKVDHNRIWSLSQDI